MQFGAHLEESIKKKLQPCRSERIVTKTQEVTLEVAISCLNAHKQHMDPFILEELEFTK
jgi:small ligand-binding sensory domain FIST